MVWHFYLNSSDLFDKSINWQSGGAVINASHEAGRFDETGVFTPGAVKDCTGTNCTWWLWFGGVHSEQHMEQVGVASALSPW